MATITTQIELYLEANSKSYKEERSNIILQNDGTEDSVGDRRVDLRRA